MIHNKKSGFTLIEIIVSIALIGILGVAFFSIFGMGNKCIDSSGNISKAAFNTQSQIEGDVGNLSTSSDIVISISISGSGTLDCKGEIDTKSALINGQKVSIKYYKPYK